MNVPARTAPRVVRTPMPRRPWLGFTRGMLHALWRALFVIRPATAPAMAEPAWQTAAYRRRNALLACVLLLSAGGTALLLRSDTLPLTQWPHALQVVLFALLFAWVSAGFVTALMGAWVLWRGDRHAMVAPSPYTPISKDARTAIVMPICNEDIATVFGGLRATCESLAATGALKLFDIYILSDTSDPALRRAELEAFCELRRVLGDEDDATQGRIFYRLRRRRTRRKAGNVADFCRRWGSNYRYMVVLDADSVMSGAALVNLVRTMEAHPKAGIVQTLPMAVGHDTLHARSQQFAARVTGRLFAVGLAYWQLGESHYWGHNAIIRVQAFMQHCGLAALPGRGGLSGEILSHDFVEAALMRRAGYEVWLMPSLGGSWEQHPPNLLDELQRDRRWCQGNLQNARLVAEPGLRPVHRAMLATGAMSYLVAPLWLAFVVIGAQAALSSYQSGSFGFNPSSLDGWVSGLTHGLWALTLTLLVLPRLLGVLAVVLRGEQRSFGGTGRLFLGALIELVLSTLQAPVRMVAHTLFVVGALTGLKLDWKSPARDASAVRWGDALARVGLFAVPALAGGLLVARGETMTAVLMAPLLLPLLLAVPLVVVTGNEGPGAALRRRNLLLVPEESRPARPLQRSRPGHPLFTEAPRLTTHAPVRMMPTFAFVTAIFTITMVPRPLTPPPDPPASLNYAMVETRHFAASLEDRVVRKVKTRTAQVRRRPPQQPVVTEVEYKAATSLE